MGRIPRGMRDIGPKEALKRKKLLATIENAFAAYGFSPIETPALEYLSVLKAKCGEEAGGQIYQIDDMGMRFEFTAGLARMVSNSSFPKPFKAYQVGPVWRRDEPQKGRYRQFWQADIDIIGSNSPKCEAELIAVADSILKKIGIKNPTIRLNSRETLKDMILKSGIDSEKISFVMRELDKIKKKGAGSVKDSLRKEGVDDASIKNLFKMIESKKKDFVGVEGLERIVELAGSYGVTNIKIDYSLARGLGYYTSNVIEIEEGSGIGTIVAGGRYDELLGIYGSPAPAVGLSFGIDRITEILGQEGKGPLTGAKVFIGVIDDGMYG